MKRALTVAEKDLKSLLFSPMFFILSSLITAIISFLYLRSLDVFIAKSNYALGGMPGAEANMNLHYEVFASLISFVNIVLVFVVPILCMRLLAEEKRLRTYDLLLTAPITALDIALGKFLAGFGVIVALIATTALYPFGSLAFADFYPGPVITSYIGLTCMGGVYVAIGLFASSLTGSLFISAFVGIIFNLIVLVVLGQSASAVNDPALSAVFEHLSVNQHFIGFLKGNIKISSVVYYLSLMGLFIFVSQRVIESSRWR